jgi:hypothetical protein
MSEKPKLSFVPLFDPWCIYHAADGSSHRARLILTAIRRKVGEFNDRGEPEYEYEWRVALDSDAPASLHRDYVETPAPGEVKH